MPSSIRDLAKKLNLSITTVSRALDGYDDVAESTRQRVVQAAQEMGYEPSSAARHLRRKRSDSIGYILPTNSPRFSDPFYADFIAGACDEAVEHNFDLIVSSSPPGSDFEKALYNRWFRGTRVDGMLVNRARVKDWRIEHLAKNHIPFVVLGITSSKVNFPYIVVNEQGGFQRLVAHLAQKGHKRIAYIGGPPELKIHVERFTGYKQGLVNASLEFDKQLVAEGNLTEEGGFTAAHQLLSVASPPTAILGCNDQTAIGVLRAAHDLGLVVGKDLAVAGFDGIRETGYTNPPLTTLSQPTYDIARDLASMVIALINGITLDQPQRIIEPELIIRASTG
jgi:LacI family transcriptional regulator